LGAPGREKPLEIGIHSTAYGSMTNTNLPASDAKVPSEGRLSPDQALALDFVLGLLDEPELNEAVRRYEAEEAFARLVASYRARLGAQDDAMESGDSEMVTPKPETWTEIAARTGIDKLDGNDTPE
jgi:anti-sigma-K factor RskA